MMSRRRLIALAGTGAGLALGRGAHGQTAGPTEPALFVPDGEGRSVWAMGVRVTLKALGEQTSGAYALFEDYVPAGVGNPAHVHTREVETWTMLEGELDWTVGDRTIQAKAGDFVHTPRGVPHRFANTSGRPARMLLTYAPAGFERWFLEIGTPTDRASAASPPPPTPEQIRQAVAAAARYGVQFTS
jgi:quercetin dioxygenase-like cupin family protein